MFKINLLAALILLLLVTKGGPAFCASLDSDNARTAKPQLDRSYNTMQDEYKYNDSRMDKIQIQNVLPLIAAKTIGGYEQQRDLSIIHSLIFIAIVIVALCILFTVVMQLKKIKVTGQLIKEKNEELAAINRKLMEHTRINEEHIGFFFKRSFSNISILEKLKRKIEHSIKMKKIDDALEIVTSIQITKEREYLFNALDDIFLKLFPNFVTTFNELLKPEDQIWPQKDQSLNTTLRIFALIRLGIKDDETIAGILDYSVSTIYTYKIRIKAKAIVRGEEFEKRLMDIKFINPENKPETVVHQRKNDFLSIISLLVAKKNFFPPVYINEPEILPAENVRECH